MPSIFTPKLLLSHLFLFSLLAGPWVLGGTGVELVEVVSNFERPVQLTHAGDGSNRLFVVERPGEIDIIDQGEVLPEPFLDIRSSVTEEGEGGLVSMAFHPRYETNGRFYVVYLTGADEDLRLRLEEYLVSSDPMRAEPDSARVILEIPQARTMHLGGQLAFGPEDYLYLSVGDGGPTGNPEQEPQDLTNLRGKILRIDVDRGDPYGIPPTNPFVGDPDALDEIYAYGFRNPWRFSFDRGSGRMFVGDVGESGWEEIDLVIRGGNYGWSIAEGDHCFSPVGPECDLDQFVRPIFEYSHEEDVGRCVLGGFVNRGPEDTDLFGKYLFADCASGKVWWLEEEATGWVRRELTQGNPLLTALGEDEEGRLYLLTLRGEVFRLAFSRREVFAHVVDATLNGGVFHSEFHISNPGAEPVEITFRFHSDDERELPLGESEMPAEDATFTVEPQSTRVIRTAGLADPAVTGWIEILSDHFVDVNQVWRLFDPSGSPLAEAGVSPAELSKTFIAPARVDPGQGVSAAIAMANPSQQDLVQVTLQYLVPGPGVTPPDLLIDEVSFDLQPGQRRAAFLQEIIDLPAGPLTGTVKIEATHEIVGTIFETRNGLFLFEAPDGTR